MNSTEQTDSGWVVKPGKARRWLRWYSNQRRRFNWHFLIFEIGVGVGGLIIAVVHFLVSEKGMHTTLDAIKAMRTELVQLVTPKSESHKSEPRPPTVKEFIDRAGELDDAGQLEKAIEHLDQALLVHPSSTGLRYLRGTYLKRNGDYRRAEAELSEAISQDKRFAEAYFERGSARQALEKWSAAIEDFDQTLSIESNHLKALLARAHLKLFTRTGDLGKDDLERALVIKPDEAEALYIRALFHLATSDPKKALADADAAIRLEPSYGAAYRARGRALERAGEMKQALASYSDAIERDSTDVRAYLARARLLNDTGDTDSALTDVKELLRLLKGAKDETTASTLVERSRIHLARSDILSAFADLNAAIEIDRKSDRAYFFRGVAYLSQKMFQQSIIDFDSAIALFPSPLSYLNRGIAAFNLPNYQLAIADLSVAAEKFKEQGRLNVYSDSLVYRAKSYAATDDTRALDDLASAIAANKSSYFAWSERAREHYSRNRIAEAIFDATEALKIEPSGAFALATRGAALVVAGKFDEALKDLDASIMKESKDSVALIARGDAYREKGDPSRAVVEYTRAIELEPQWVEALQRRGDALMQLSAFGAAIDDFGAALKISLQSSLLRSRAVAHEKLGLLSEAFNDYSSALNLEPDDVGTLDSRCWVAMSLEKIREAEADCDKAMRIRPSGLVYESRGYVFLKQKKFDQAVADFGVAIDRFRDETGSDGAASFFGRGLAKQRKGEIAAAESDFERAREAQTDIEQRMEHYGIRRARN